ncbi:hypothetical protein [Mycobacterium uberis]|uniref:hypothetical protein n=1 Tax=Mycobacterium uberis TaxID=2162698 RepID=UPI0014029C9D|nr:hypothetical protein [Mycobacterium uberis]
MREHANGHLQRMIDTVFDEDRIIDKFIGDAMMAVFGAPIPQGRRRPPAPFTRRCALCEEIDRFNEKHRTKGSVEIYSEIGLRTGSLIAVNIGSDRKISFGIHHDRRHGECD